MDFSYSANELEDICGALRVMSAEDNNFIPEVLVDEDIDFAECVEDVYKACKEFIAFYETCLKNLQ